MYIICNKRTTDVNYLYCATENVDVKLLLEIQYLQLRISANGIFLLAEFLQERIMIRITHRPRKNSVR